MKRPVGALAFLCFIPFSGAAGQHVQNEGLVHTLGPERTASSFASSSHP
jgi:hypothetical protein